MTDPSPIHALRELSFGSNRQGLSPAPKLRLVDISPAQQQLIRLLQHVQFGRLEDLVIKNGQPLFDPSPTVIRLVRFQDGPERKPLPPKPDSRLHTSHVRLLDLISTIQNATVATLIVDAGLPVRAEIRIQVIDP